MGMQDHGMGQSHRRTPAGQPEFPGFRTAWQIQSRSSPVGRQALYPDQDLSEWVGASIGSWDDAKNGNCISHSISCINGILSKSCGNSSKDLRLAERTIVDA